MKAEGTLMSKAEKERVRRAEEARKQFEEMGLVPHSLFATRRISVLSMQNS